MDRYESDPFYKLTSKKAFLFDAARTRYRGWLCVRSWPTRDRGTRCLLSDASRRRSNADLTSLDASDIPSVVGVAIRAAWSEFQSTPEKFDWSYLDTAIRIAEAKKKLVAISVIAGIYSPNWVLVSANLLQFTGRDAKRSRTAPAPWDQKYLGAWKTFVEALGSRYDGNSAIGCVTATGPGRAEECYLVDDAEDAFQFDANKWVAAAREIIGYYNPAFKKTPWVLAWGKPSLMLNQLMVDIYDV
jgi:Beta-galactosidase